MADFEDRLRTALRSAGDDAPGGVGLAGAARRRADARRRRTSLTSAAAVVAIVAVVGGAAMLGNRGGGHATPASGGPSATTTAVDETPPAERVESWRDIQVTVPSSWRYGGMSDWCASGGKLDDPVIERTGQVVLDILCDPAVGYGVQFLDAAAFDFAKRPGVVWQYTPADVAVYPTGAWLGYQQAGDNIVRVVMPTRAQAEDVLGSFVHTTSVDTNGCAPHPTEQMPAVADGSVRLCRYDLDDWLEQSETLSGDDAAAAVAALEAAPAKGDRMCTMELTGPVVLVTSSTAQGRVTLDACQGFSWDGADHDLTADVLYWMLSPGWSGGVSGDVPMPEKLRQ